MTVRIIFRTLLFALTYYGCNPAISAEAGNFACASEASRLPLIQKIRLFSDDFVLYDDGAKLIEISREDDWTGFFTYATDEEFENFALMSDGDGWLVFYFNDTYGKLYFIYMFGDQNGNCVKYPEFGLPIPLVGLPDAVEKFYYEQFSGRKIIQMDGLTRDEFYKTMNSINLQYEKKLAASLDAELRALPKREFKPVPSPPSK